MVEEGHKVRLSDASLSSMPNGHTTECIKENKCVILFFKKLYGLALNLSLTQ